MSGSAGVRATGRLVAVVLVLGAIGAALGLTFSIARPVTYTSEAQVVIGSASSASLFQSFQDSPSDRSLETQAQLVTGDDVVSTVADATGLSEREVRSSVEAEVATGSDVILLRASRPTAAQAQEVLQSVVDSFVATNRQTIVNQLQRQARALTPIIRELSNQVAGAEENQSPASTDALASLQEQRGQFRAAARSESGAAQVIASPTRPPSPSSVDRTVAIALGAAVGVALGFGLALALRSRRAGTAEAELSGPPRRRA